MDSYRVEGSRKLETVGRIQSIQDNLAYYSSDYSAPDQDAFTNRVKLFYMSAESKTVTDTSAIVAVINGEPEKDRIISLTNGLRLIAPSSVHWEIGNALSAMIKRRRVTLEQAKEALKAYNQLKINFVDVELDVVMQLSERLNIYAYDAYLLVCAQQEGCPLLTLDSGLIRAATQLGIQILEL